MSRHQNAYDLTRPCADCPFRKDRPFYLRAARVLELQDDTVRPFSCHNTLDNDDSKPDGYMQQHCAGALILRTKLQEPTLVMHMAQALGFFDPSRLDMNAPVYDSWDEMVIGCSKPR